MPSAPSSPQFVPTFQLLRALIAGLHRSARAIEAASGVTNAQLYLLRQIGAASGLSVTELAARLGARQNAVSPVLARLIAGGLVDRRPAAGDARRAELSLSARGRRLLRRSPDTTTEELLTALASLSPARIGGLTLGLRDLLAAMGIDPAAAPLLFEPTTPRRAGKSRAIP